MQQPAIFTETRIPVMHALMHAHPFASLVTQTEGALMADHLPLVLHTDEGAQGVLRGHLAVTNPLCRITRAIPALCIFQGPQAYVTPSWYASKQAHGKVVPTWNYVAVHARGAMVLQRDPAWLMRHLDDLTAQHEGQRPEPWSVSDAPADFMARMLKGLVGFEIKIESLQGTWKVSQNKSPEDRKGVARGLDASDGSAVAKLVAEAKD